MAKLVRRDDVILKKVSVNMATSNLLIRSIGKPALRKEIKYV